MDHDYCPHSAERIQVHDRANSICSSASTVANNCSLYISSNCAFLIKISLSKLTSKVETQDVFWRNSWVGTRYWGQLEDGQQSSDTLHTNDRSFPSSLLSLLEPFSEEWRSLVCFGIPSGARSQLKVLFVEKLYLTYFSRGVQQLYPSTFFKLARLAQGMDLCFY
jgi:hypothetical protein